MCMKEVRVTTMSHVHFIRALTSYATFHKQTYHSDTAEICLEIKNRLEKIDVPDTIKLTEKEHDALEIALNNDHDDQQNAHDFL